MYKFAVFCHCFRIPGAGDLHWILAAGSVQHRVISSVPLRIGFQYQPAPSDPDLSRTIFTFGAGLPPLGDPLNPNCSSLQFDLAGHVGLRSY